MHRHTAWGQWAVHFVQCSATLPRDRAPVKLLHCAGPQVGGTRSRAEEAVAALKSGILAVLCHTCSRQCNSCIALSHCLETVGSATPALLCHTAWGQCEVQLRQCTASLSGGSGQRNFAMHCQTIWGQWAVRVLHFTAPLFGGSGQWNSCIVQPCYLGQRAVQLLDCTAPRSWGSGQCSSCNTLTHRLRVAGSGTPALRGPGDGRCRNEGNPCNAPPHCLGVVNS